MSLNREERKALRSLGWRRVRRKKAKRPRSMNSKHFLELGIDIESPNLVPLELENCI